MAFKMKQSPAKGKLGDFFKGVGKKITEGRQKRVDKQLESKKGTEYEGMTSMEAARAEKKSRKSGESKFQADSRRMGEKKRADKKANKAASSIKGEKDNAKPKPKQAFAAARKAGKKTFSFNGKSFTTELAETKKTDKKTKPGQVDLKTGNINVDYAKKKK